MVLGFCCYDKKPAWEGKGLTSAYGLVHMKEKQGRNSRQEPEAGIEAETMMKCHLLACSSWLCSACSVLLFITCPRVEPPGRLGSPTSVVNQENY